MIKYVILLLLAASYATAVETVMVNSNGVIVHPSAFCQKNLILQGTNLPPGLGFLPQSVDATGKVEWNLPTNLVATSTNIDWSAIQNEPDFASSSSVAAIEANTSSWNTAYGWGNHALAGYYPASNPSNYVTQSVTNGILVSAKSYTDSSTNALWTSTTGYVSTSVVSSILIATNQVFGQAYTNDMTGLEYLKFGVQITNVVVGGYINSQTGSVSNWFDGSFSLSSVIETRDPSGAYITIYFNTSYYGTVYVYGESIGNVSLKCGDRSKSKPYFISTSTGYSGASGYFFDSFRMLGNKVTVSLDYGTPNDVILSMYEMVIIARPSSSININRVME